MQLSTFPYRYLKFCVSIGIIVLWFFSASAQTRKEYLLQTDWKFIKGEHAGAQKTDFKDAARQSVTVPHDWAICGPLGQDNDKQKIQIAVPCLSEQRVVLKDFKFGILIQNDGMVKV